MVELGLENNVTLVCQDWGGLVGLSVVKENPDAFSNLVIMNTGLPIGEDQGKQGQEIVTYTYNDACTVISALSYSLVNFIMLSYCDHVSHTSL
jgi:pimeloyl-ACP methyl ester carboxylesterase